jgi:plasmid stabilization system protein ParE
MKNMAGSKNSFLVVFSEEALADRERAIEYYQERSFGLGFAWEEDYERTETRLEQNPESFPEYLFFVRRALLNRFPFSVFYAINDIDKTVVIIGILHQSQDIDIIRQRINAEF